MPLAALSNVASFGFADVASFSKLNVVVGFKHPGFRVHSFFKFTIMKTSAAFVVYGGSNSRRPGLAWQRVSKAIWNTLKRIGDLEEPDCEDVFWTPPQSPRDSSLEGSESDLSGNSNSIRKATRLLEMHDRIIDQVLWEPTVLPCPSDLRIRKCRWRQTTVCFPPGLGSRPQTLDSQLNEKRRT